MVDSNRYPENIFVLCESFVEREIIFVRHGQSSTFQTVNPLKPSFYYILHLI
jgi:hypothetical protein